MERILYADIGKHPWNEVYKIATGKTRKKADVNNTKETGWNDNKPQRKR
jgi:hypothetical protein